MTTNLTTTGRKAMYELAESVEAIPDLHLFRLEYKPGIPEKHIESEWVARAEVWPRDEAGKDGPQVFDDWSYDPVSATTRLLKKMGVDYD